MSISRVQDLWDQSLPLQSTFPCDETTAAAPYPVGTEHPSPAIICLLSMLGRHPCLTCSLVLAHRSMLYIEHGATSPHVPWSGDHAPPVCSPLTSGAAPSCGLLLWKQNLIQEAKLVLPQRSQAPLLDPVQLLAALGLRRMPRGEERTVYGMIAQHRMITWIQTEEKLGGHCAAQAVERGPAQFQGMQSGPIL